MPAMVSIDAATLAASGAASYSAARLEPRTRTGPRQLDGRHSAVVRVVDAFCGLPDTDNDRRVPINSHVAYRLCRICRASSAVSDGGLPTFTPAASRASFLAAAVPDDPDTMAPA